MKRRRFIQIMATSVAGLSLPQLRASTLQPVQWRGYTLGAEGSFTLFTEDKQRAQKIMRRCFEEIRRLEKCFSLYDAESELCQLNREGCIGSPSTDWLALLNASDQAYKATSGLFDPTIQALWNAYDKHFKANPMATNGPHLEQALSQTGWQHVHYDDAQIRFSKPGMQLSLNGIAQGYITDRVSDILKEAGYEHVLVELGETRALGTHPEGRTWNLGIKDADNPSQISEIAELNNQALATSGSYGSSFSVDGHFHHLIHPQSGRPSTQWNSLSVIAPTATQADALSTGLSFAGAKQIEATERRLADIRILKQA